MEPPKELTKERSSAATCRLPTSSASIRHASPASRAASSPMRSDGRINEEVSRIDREWRAGHFNGVEYFHFRFPEQGARMAAFLMKQRLHRLVPEAARRRRRGGGRGVGATGGGTRNDPRLGAIDQDADRDRAGIPLRASPGRLFLDRSCCRGESGREGGSVDRRPDDLGGRVHRMGRTRASPMVLALLAAPPVAVTRRLRTCPPRITVRGRDNLRSVATRCRANGSDFQDAAPARPGSDRRPTSPARRMPGPASSTPMVPERYAPFGGAILPCSGV